jgi:hypothetical protein
VQRDKNLNEKMSCNYFIPLAKFIHYATMKGTFCRFRFPYNRNLWQFSAPHKQSYRFVIKLD